MNKLIVISGPTASGKTKISIDLAKKIFSKFNLSTVIVNFDSLLFYKEISIVDLYARVKLGFAVSILNLAASG